MTYQEAYDFWLTDDYFDASTKQELKSITSDDEIKERFYKDLEFGTAGLRGILGAGTNRMNIYTVGKATQGFAQYLLESPSIDFRKGVAIAHDSRHMSQEFAIATALVFNANGIETYVYDGLRPTPQLSYTVRKLGCAGGVMITASHNPPEYNGYKVYGPDGAQVNSPYDEEIIGYVNNTRIDQIKTMSLDDAKAQGLYHILSEDLDQGFQAECLAIAISPELIKAQGDLPLVYTPIHGAGHIPTVNLLKAAGFTNVHVVAEQAEPNGDFPTVKYPNPEEEQVYDLGKALADKIGADVIFASDPDADRVGVVARDDNGAWYKLNGNQTGVLLTEYILTQLRAQGKLPQNAAVVTSIVSSDMTQVIAMANNVDCFEVFTGFKYIGELIKKFETTGSHQFVYGFEESYGYLLGEHARDKDAVGIAMMVAEIAAYCKSRRITIPGYLNEIYLKYGFFKEETISLTLKGIAGLEKIGRIMDYFTAHVPTDIAGTKVVEYRNYKVGRLLKITETGEEAHDLDFPKSNVRSFKLADESWICVRPSGTEPKLKLYIGVVRGTEEDAQVQLKKLADEVMRLVDNIE